MAADAKLLETHNWAIGVMEGDAKRAAKAALDCKFGAVLKSMESFANASSKSYIASSTGPTPKDIINQRLSLEKQMYGGVSRVLTRHCKAKPIR